MGKWGGRWEKGEGYGREVEGKEMKVGKRWKGRRLERETERKVKGERLLTTVSSSSLKDKGAIQGPGC